MGVGVTVKAVERFFSNFVEEPCETGESGSRGRPGKVVVVGCFRSDGAVESGTSGSSFSGTFGW